MTDVTIPTMNVPVTCQAITASLVPEDERLAFLPRFFGNRLILKGEALVYEYMRKLCSSYKGALWNFYTLSNGGFYLAPSLGEQKLPLFWYLNYFEAQVSCDAAGIIATLYALNYLADNPENKHLIESYYLLRHFALLDHEEGPLIQAAID